MITGRYYRMSADERDQKIRELRAKGWPYHKIGKVVGMSPSGVCRALERMGRGKSGLDARE